MACTENAVLVGRLVVWMGLLAAGCGPDPQSAAPAPAPAPAAAPAPAPAPALDPKAEAATIFATRCTPCHGPTGAGDGPASKALVPPPRNFGDPAWQDSVSDAHIEKIIQLGGAAVGKAPTMPPNPDLVGKLAVVAALREHIRALKGTAAPAAPAAPGAPAAPAPAAPAPPAPAPAAPAPAAQP
jgi:hypothetical protein